MIKQTIVDKFIEAKNTYYNQICIATYGKRYTYGDIDNLSNYIARELCHIGKKKQSPILVFCDSPVLISSAILGVMKSNNIYVPVTPRTPIWKITEIIQDCNIQAYISEYEHKDIELPHIIFNNKSVVDSVDFTPHTSPEDYAYIIYTSGSSGKSKGVLIQHKGLLNAVIERNRILELTNNCHSISLMSPSFDGFFTNFFSPIIEGAILYFPQSLFNIDSILSTIRDNDIRTFLCTPTMFQTILNQDEGCLKNVRMVSLAGEKVNQFLIDSCVEKYPYLKIANEYGPTENSICTSINTDVRNRIPISAGKVIKNVQALILNETKSICSEYEPGEVYLSGVGLFVGYVNDARLTESRFIQYNNNLWYQTGDIAYWDEYSNLVIVGRYDTQVKVNGYRIDLEEIQNRLQEHENISASVVIYDERSGLVAYYISNIVLNNSDLIKFLQTRLNDYMIPTAYFQLSHLPMLDSGKIDRNALSKLIIHKNNMTDVESCSNIYATIHKITEIYNRVLHIDFCKSYDSFFALGGNSLNSVILCDRIFDEFGCTINLDDIRFYPTPGELANKVHSLINEEGEINQIKPFNRFWFIDCYFTSILSILELASRPLAPFIRSFVVKSVDFNNTYQYLYENKKPLVDIFLDLAMEFETGVFENDFYVKILPLLGKNRVVLVHVDCYYLPYCREKYQKEHYEHVITLIDYNDTDNIFRVIDQDSLDSVSFKQYLVNYYDVEKAAYAEIVNRDTFDGVDFVSIYPHPNMGYKPCSDLDDTQLTFVIQRTIEYLEENNIDISTVLQRLMNYLKVEEEVYRYVADMHMLSNLEKIEIKLKRFFMENIENLSHISTKEALINMLQNINLY